MGNLKKRVEEFIRVDHAGERGAVKIYEGQLLALNTLVKDENLKKIIEEMKIHEKEHCEFFEKEIKKRKIKPTKFLPLWDLLGVGLGFGSTLLGKKAAMLCTASVEEVIDEHYQNQIDQLGSDEKNLKKKIIKFREDELHHKDIAYERGATKKGLYSIMDKVIKTGLGTGLSAQQIRARTEAKNTIEAFEQKFLKNVNKRKKLKRKLDPEKRAKDLAAASERRVTRRIKEKDVALTDREKNLNLEQRKNAKKYNNIIRKNPNLILKNNKLINDLSITVTKDGDIVKVPTGLTEEFLEKRGLFEIEHQRDIFKKGRGKDLPYNRNLIAAPYNRAGGFKEMAEKYIESNPDPDDPKVKKILEKAKELKITIRPNVPKGTFPTVALGYKQLSDPVERILDVGEKTLNLKIASEIDRPEKALTKELFENALNRLIKKEKNWLITILNLMKNYLKV